MMCAEIHDQLIETARARELSSDVRAIVFTHCAGCARCAATLENERALTAALSDLALDIAPMASRIEANLRRELMNTPKPAARWKYAAMGAIAASILILGAVTGVHFKAGVTATQTAVASDDEGEFVALPFAEPASADEVTSVVRVKMDRESLEALGLPVSAELAGQQIDADVVVGSDGAPEAIRILN